MIEISTPRVCVTSTLHPPHIPCFPDAHPCNKVDHARLPVGSAETRLLFGMMPVGRALAAPTPLATRSLAHVSHAFVFVGRAEAPSPFPSPSERRLSRAGVRRNVRAQPVPVISHAPRPVRRAVRRTRLAWIAVGGALGAPFKLAIAPRQRRNWRQFFFLLAHEA